MVQDAGMQVQTCSASIEVTIITTKSAGTLTAHRLVPSPKRRSRVATAATHVTPICTSTTPYGLPDLLTESLFKSVIPIEQAAQLTAASKASLPRAAPTSANSELRVGSSRSPCCMGSASYRVGAIARVHGCQRNRMMRPDISWFVVSATENLRSLVVADEGGGLKLRRARGSLILSYLDITTI
jgi:hypothetical protein